MLRWLKNEARGPRLARLFAIMSSHEEPEVRLRTAVGLFYVRRSLLSSPCPAAQCRCCRPNNRTSSLLSAGSPADVF
jgi:hypothetical protein